VVPGISDAGAHLNIFQDGTTPTTMLTHWARDRTKGTGTMPLEFCVMKQARDTAHMYGLVDRGTLEVGKKADLNMVDMCTIEILPPEHGVPPPPAPAARPRRSLSARAAPRSHSRSDEPRLRKAPRAVNDLPSGAPRWDQKCVGYDMTVQSGVVTFEGGEWTGSLPGGLVRTGLQGEK
jgi:N-acyl-D-aspartate/D-glutamate deacylase